MTPSDRTDLSIRDARELFERDYMVNQLRACGGNVSRAAQAAGMERSAFHRKMRGFGIAVERVPA